MKLGLIETPGFEEYALLDSGEGQKLERFGDRVLVRPEAQAIWSRRRPPEEWERADAVFTGDTDKEGAGRWRSQPGLAEVWEARRGAVRMSLALTSFRHTGVFPEQEAHWAWVEERLPARAGAEDPSVLNLFGYTGVASLVAATKGARVTHVDASKKAVAWARDNAALSELADKPVRWIVEDAGKFAAREVRRGRLYDGVILDPPKFGRGPKGERWDLFADLPALLADCAAILKPDGFLVLTAYAIRASALAFGELTREVVAGAVECGELALKEEGGRLLSTSLYARVDRLERNA